MIVRLKPGADIDALAKALGAKVIARNDKLHLYELLFPDEAATDAALGELKSNSEVEAVDYNYVFDPPVTPQPLANVPAGMGPPALTLAHSTQGDPCNPVVGMIDTEIQSLGGQLDQFITKQISVVGDAASGTSGSTHIQSLASQVDQLTPKQISTPNNNSSASPTHGTAMAETILRAVAQAGGGSSSVRIVAVDVYGANETTTSWNVALGIQAAVDNGATVLNLSLGGTSDSAVLDSIIQQALAQGVVIFAAAETSL